MRRLTASPTVDRSVLMRSYAVSLISRRITDLHRIPCGRPGGIDGVLPQAGICAPSLMCRISRAPPPISTTNRAKTSEKLNASFSLVTRAHFPFALAHGNYS
jgi:hypothetical protein